MSSTYIYYQALNGTRKTVDLKKMHRIPGSGDAHVIYVSRHCGGLLAIRATPQGGVEITADALEARLQQTGQSLPWKEEK